MSSEYGIILVVLMFVSGIVWLIDSLTAGKKRKKAIAQLYEQMLNPPQETIDAIAQEPIYVDYARSFFPILLFIVVLRSFLWEPFQIPSGSMKPTLTEGDFILVNKFDYGLRLPINSKKFIDIGLPKRGDVAVFRAPDTGEDFIKRVVGLPGDKVVYTRKKELYVKPLCAAGVPEEECPEQMHILKTPVPGPGYIDKSPNSTLGLVNVEYIEYLDGVEHGILNNPSRMSQGLGGDLVFLVPEGKYFVLGDNRDNSTDSRFWKTTNYVPEENLVGHAVSIWIHFEFEMTGESFYGFPIGWIPTGIDFSRVGAIK